ncbi:MAG: molybdopterin-guanine dinucleotide biosynthesis protein B [Deltaproteobacteria bacterium]|nr:molybdopterin-guanine dinucleotide biosynthesis protein B [Deltaproteobacteria bacterium]
MMVPVVSIIGTSGSGKTTLLEQVIARLKRRGWRVAILKHDAHGFEIDREGKDSWRHKKAGAKTVALSSPDKFAVIRDTAVEWPPERIIASYLTDADIVITEGFKKGPFPKIEVVRAAHSKKPVCGKDPLLLAYVTDVALKGGVPVFGLDDYNGVTRFIEKEVLRKAKPSTVSLIVDGEHVPLKPFIEVLLREAVIGMTRSLKGCEKARDVEIKVRRSAPRKRK